MSLRGRAGAIALVLGLTAVLALGAPIAGAKKKKGGGAINITKPVNALVPDRAPGATTPLGLLTSTIDVGKQFKGRQIRDVNVTVQTTGASGNNPAEQLIALLTAPNGATAVLFSGLEGFGPTNPSIGPLTLDDEATLLLGEEDPTDPVRLYVPWAGTAVPEAPLFPMDNGPARGTWTLLVLDANGGQTSALNSWRLNVVTGKPFLTK